MQKVYISLFIVVLFSCCTSSSSKEEELECSVEINNKDLIEAITEYQEMMYDEFKKSIERGDSVYVSVCSKDINDSISRYVICPVAQMDYLEFDTPFDLCKVNGHYVLVSYRPAYHICNTPITFTEEVCRNYEKKLFPKQYEERERNLQRGFLVCGPDYCYLTFLGDNLIDKTFKHGMSRDKIPVKLNGKEVYL